jgi:hypothetical protein
MKNEWLTFEQAGQFIDGPNGWRSEVDGVRYSAQSLIMFAKDGRIATKAEIWNCRAKNEQGERNGTADEAERSTFLLMLLNREKRQTDEWSSNSCTIGFALADERRGNFKAVRVEAGQWATESFVFDVVGLKFRRTDLASVFSEKALRSSSKQSKLKRLPEALLLEWWNGLDEETKAVSQNEHLRLCIAQFPDHHVARERVRELTRGRTVGRKPLGGKTTA